MALTKVSADVFNTSLVNTFTVAVTVSNTLTVSSNAVFSNAVSVAGNSSHTGVAAFSNTVAVTGAATFSNTVTVTGNATFSNVVTITGSLKLNQVLETKTTPTISSGVLTLDLSTGNVFEVSLSSSITNLTISNAPVSGTNYGFTLKLNIAGSYTITWPVGIKWAYGQAPTLTSTNGKVDTLVFYTVDGGTTYYGFIAGQNA